MRTDAGQGHCCCEGMGKGFPQCWCLRQGNAQYRTAACGVKAGEGLWKREDLDTIPLKPHKFTPTCNPV